MPRRLKRYHGRGDLHFITFSYDERRALLGTASARDLFAGGPSFELWFLAVT